MSEKMPTLDGSRLLQFMGCYVASRNNDHHLTSLSNPGSFFFDNESETMLCGLIITEPFDGVAFSNRIEAPTAQAACDLICPECLKKWREM